MPSKNTKLQEKLSIRFRKLLSGATDGTPPWLAVVAEGNDVGMFSPQDAPWIIHRDFSTLVGGVRALLMQALHPGSLADLEHPSHRCRPCRPWPPGPSGSGPTGPHGRWRCSPCCRRTPRWPARTSARTPARISRTRGASDWSTRAVRACSTVRPAASRIMAKTMRKKHSGMKLKFCRLYPIGLNVS